MKPTLTRRRRDKLFGYGRCVPLDREAKVRIKTLARALSHPTAKGKHYGEITDKFLAVLDALLWGFHNAATGRCFPSYESIAEKAHCNRDTVYRAIHALERAGILKWVNRITRIREMGVDLFGKAANRWRVIRTSNAYTFNDPQPCAKPPNSSKSEITTGTTTQVSFLTTPRPSSAPIEPHQPLLEALERLKRAMTAPPALKLET